MKDIYTSPSEKDKELNNSNISKTNDEKLIEIENKLTEQRNSWGEKIIILIKKIKEINTLNEAQVDMLSYRHMLIDVLTKYRIRVRKSKTSYEKHFKTKFLSYYDYDYKINDKQKVDMVNADLFFYRRQLGLLESQVDYFKECISTLDKMGFAIKNRVNLEEF